MLFQSQMLSSTDQDQREMARDEVMSFRHECIRKCQTITSSYPLRWPRPSGVHRTLQILFGHHSGHVPRESIVSCDASSQALGTCLPMAARVEMGKKTAALRRRAAFLPRKTSWRAHWDSVRLPAPMAWHRPRCLCHSREGALSHAWVRGGARRRHP